MLLASFGPIIGGLGQQLFSVSRPMSSGLTWLIIVGSSLALVGFNLERRHRRSRRRLAQKRAGLA
jgi:hypothetical protein